VKEYRSSKERYGTHTRKVAKLGASLDELIEWHAGNRLARHVDGFVKAVMVRQVLYPF